MSAKIFCGIEGYALILIVFSFVFNVFKYFLLINYAIFTSRGASVSKLVLVKEDGQVLCSLEGPSSNYLVTYIHIFKL